MKSKLPTDKFMSELLGEKAWKIKKILISTDSKIRKLKGYE